MRSESLHFPRVQRNSFTKNLMATEHFSYKFFLLLLQKQSSPQVDVWSAYSKMCWCQKNCQQPMDKCMFTCFVLQLVKSSVMSEPDYMQGATGSNKIKRAADKEARVLLLLHAVLNPLLWILLQKEKKKKGVICPHVLIYSLIFCKHTEQRPSVQTSRSHDTSPHGQVAFYKYSTETGFSVRHGFIKLKKKRFRQYYVGHQNSICFRSVQDARASLLFQGQSYEGKAITGLITSCVCLHLPFLANFCFCVHLP